MGNEAEQNLERINGDSSTWNDLGTPNIHNVQSLGNRAIFSEESPKGQEQDQLELEPTQPEGALGKITVVSPVASSDVEALSTAEKSQIYPQADGNISKATIIELDRIIDSTKDADCLPETFYRKVSEARKTFQGLTQERGTA